MIKILFVCLGNICRSPLAEAIFNHKLKNQGLEKRIMSDSVGTSNYHVGEKPDSRTIKIAEEYGVPIDHKGKQFKKNDVEIFDYIIAMDSCNFRNIVRKSGGESKKMMLLRNFDYKDRGKAVPDPWYGGAEEFENVYQIINRSLDEFILFLRKKHTL